MVNSFSLKFLVILISRIKNIVYSILIFFKGDNVLAVVKYLGHSNILAHTEESNKGSVVFFDLLGLCLVYYPEWIGIILNIAVVSISIGSTVNKAKNSFQYGVTSKMYLSQLGFTFLIQLMGCVASYMVVTVIAFFLDTVGMYDMNYQKIFFYQNCYNYYIF